MSTLHRLAVFILLCSSGCSSSGASQPGSPDGSVSDGSSIPACPRAMVSFALRLPPGGATTYCLGPGASCAGDDWLSIAPADGGPALALLAGCVTDCTACQPIACSNLCAIASPLGDAGVQTSWDGTYLEYATCGASSLTCTTGACAPKGSYVAHLCAYAAQPDASPVSFETCTLASSTPTCTDIAFEWPPPTGSASYEATVGTAGDDAGGD